jgi:chemotaxis protein methyltransferase CheR
MRAAPKNDDEAVAYISRQIYDRCRIRLDSGKHALIKARLGKRLRHHGFSDLSGYCQFLQSSAGEDEFTLVVNALTTNFTNFMREPDHFDFLLKTAVPAFRSKGEKSLRIWSAACSSGEEPYTIALYLQSLAARGEPIDWSILASDVSTSVLAKAQTGIYARDRLTAIQPDWLQACFQQGVGEWKGYCRVKRAIRDRITFRQINLAHSYDHSQRFHVIFCRNVMIYFDRQTQEQLARRLCSFLAPGGFLITGHAESLTGLSLPLRCVRASIHTHER